MSYYWSPIIIYSNSISSSLRLAIIKYHLAWQMGELFLLKGKKETIAKLADRIGFHVDI
jgi:hypothetical protein